MMKTFPTYRYVLSLSSPNGLPSSLFLNTLSILFQERESYVVSHTRTVQQGTHSSVF